MSTGDEETTIRDDCWKEALFAFGTAYLFKERAARFRRSLRALTFLGIAVPVLVAGVITSFGVSAAAVPYVLTAAAVFSLVQGVGSVCSLVYRWDDALAYASESVTDNMRLAAAFEELGKRPPPKKSDLKTRHDVLRAENASRREQDEKQDIGEKERRKGMRAALRQYRKTCVGCNKTPTSMEPSDCPVCGQFGRWKKTVSRGRD